MSHRILQLEKVRFLLVGVVNTTLDFLLLNMFTLVFGIYFVLSNILSVIICIFISYTLNHYFVFHKKEGIKLHTILTFFAVTGFSSLALQSIIIIGMHWTLNTQFSRSLIIVSDIADNQTLELNIIKALAVGVGMVWNFMFYKYIVFKEKPTKTEAEFIG